MKCCSVIGVLALCAQAQAFLVATPLSCPVARASTGLRMSSAEGALQAAFKKIEADQELRPSDHPEALGLDSFSVGDVSGTIQGFLGTKLDWTSLVTIKGKDSETLSLNCWTFPMFDVPHLSLSVTKGGGTVTLKADVIPKDDVAYSQDYLEQYYGDAGCLAWHQALVDSPLTTPLPAPATLRGRALSSPNLVQVSAADGADAHALFADSIAKITDMWLGWLEDAAEIPRVRRGTMLGRDNTLRRMSWAVSCKEPVFGDQAKEIAMAIAGPGDAAYTGQYS